MHALGLYKSNARATSIESADHLAATVQGSAVLQHGLRAQTTSEGDSATQIVSGVTHPAPYRVTPLPFSASGDPDRNSASYNKDHMSLLAPDTARSYDNSSRNPYDAGLSNLLNQDLGADYELQYNAELNNLLNQDLGADYELQHNAELNNLLNQDLGADYELQYNAELNNLLNQDLGADYELQYNAGLNGLLPGVGHYAFNSGLATSNESAYPIN